MPLPTLIYEVREGVLVFAGYNAAADDLAMHRTKRLLGKSAHEIYADEPEIIADLETCLQRRIAFRRALTHKMRTTGETKEMIVTYVPAADGLVAVHIEDVTWQKRIEAVLNERQERFEAIVEHSFDLIAELDARGRIIYISPNAKEILGYETDELVGRGLMRLVHPADRKRAGDRARCAKPVTYRVVTRSGEARWHEGTGRSYTTATGETREVIISRDVSERSRAGEELRENEATLRALLESAAEGVLAADDQGRITFLNAKVEELFGYSKEELLGQPVELLVPVRYQKPHRGQRRRFEESREPRPAGHGRDLPAVRKDGSEFIVEISLSPIETRRGRLTLAIINDVTPRKRAEEELRRFADRLATLHDIDRAILSLHPVKQTARVAIRRLRSAIRCQRVGLTVIEAVSAEATLVAVDGAGKDVYGQGSRNVPEILGSLRLLGKGQPRIVQDIARLRRRSPGLDALAEKGLRSFAVVPMLAGGRLVGALTVWWDRAGGATPERLAIASEVAAQLAVAVRQEQMLAQISDHAAEMQRQVAQRTAELSARNEELQAFAYSVSHDLRAPLRAMRGFGEALLEDYGDRLDGTAREFTQRIVEAAAHMDDLIHDLLEYSRVARAQVKLQPVDVGEIVATALQHLRPEIEATHAQVTTALARTKVMGHPQVLTQVVANLLGNALKFRRPGKPAEVTVRSVRRGKSVRIEVHDRGIGIRREHTERIFRIFERLHGMEEYPGTGIGLAIVKKGVDRLGGKLGVQSKPRQGSTFWIELPAASAEEG